MASGVPFNGHRLDLSLDWSMQDDWYSAEFADFKECGAALVLAYLKAELRVGDAPPMFLAPWKASLHVDALLPQPQSIEETVICLRKPVGAIP